MLKVVEKIEVCFIKEGEDMREESKRNLIVFTHLPAIKVDPISTSSPLVGALKIDI